MITSIPHPESNASASPAPLSSEVLRILRFALKRRRRGKIAALPHATREQINIMLEDGVPYRQIIARLGEAGKGLSEDCVSRWSKTCYQDWREARLHAEALAHAPNGQPNGINADLQRLLIEFDPERVAPMLNRDPARAVPLVKALARIAVACCDDSEARDVSSRIPDTGGRR